VRRFKGAAKSIYLKPTVLIVNLTLKSRKMENHTYVSIAVKSTNPIDDRNKSIAAIVAERELLPLGSSSKQTCSRK
jgi:hypothetical protein